MSDRPTPETDAAKIRLDCEDSCCAVYTYTRDESCYEGDVCSSDEMARVEQERDEAREELEKLRYALRGSQQGCEDAQKAIRRMERKYDDLLELARELRDALEKCQYVIGAPKSDVWATEDECDTAYNAAISAITKANQLLP